MLWFTAIDRVGPSRASLFANLQFFLAAVFGVILLSETITPLAGRRRRRDRRRDPAQPLPARARAAAGRMNRRGERLARTPPGYHYTIGRVLAIYSG